MSHSQRERWRKRLEDERDRLEGLRLLRGVATGSNELSAADQHPADLGTETFEREKELSLLSRIEDDLQEVEGALRRLSNGTYGECERCGTAIDADRLRARPATRLCRRDQLESEREARNTEQRSRTG